MSNEKMRTKYTGSGGRPAAGRTYPSMQHMVVLAFLRTPDRRKFQQNLQRYFFLIAFSGGKTMDSQTSHPGECMQGRCASRSPLARLGVRFCAWRQKCTFGAVFVLTPKKRIPSILPGLSWQGASSSLTSDMLIYIYPSRYN